MTGIARESWTVVGFVVLGMSAVTVSAAGWVHFVRERRLRRESRSPSEG